MTKVAIVTDSNAGIHQSEKLENLFILPMPFTIEDGEFFEDVNLSTQEFYTAMLEDKKILTYDIHSNWPLDTYTEVIELDCNCKIINRYDYNSD